MVKLEHVVMAGGVPRTLIVETGALVHWAVRTNEVGQHLLEILLGLRAPHQGKVFVLDTPLYDHALPANFYQRLGVVPYDGGLVSNLKVWENLSLPYCYHDGRLASDLENPVRHCFRESQMDETALVKLMGQVPATLSLWQKKWVGLVRVFLGTAELVIYEGIFEGLSPIEQVGIRKAILTFHRQQPNRTTLFITAQAATLATLPIDQRIEQEAIV